MKRSVPMFSSMVMVLCVALSANAAVILQDHFDDGVLDPTWSVSLVNASGWTYNESGSELIVTDIMPTLVDPYWGKVILARSFSSLGDFHLDFDFSWDSHDSLDGYQIVYVTLYDSSHNVIAFAGYQDPWHTSTGQKVLVIGADHEHHGANYQNPSDYYLSALNGISMPQAGSAQIKITRLGGYLQFFWDGDLLLSGFADTPVSRMDIQFWYVIWGNSFFGTETVDLVRLTDAAPEPNISVSPSNYDFGEMNLGSSSATIVTISNVGDADLNITDIHFQDGSSPDFSITPPPTMPATLAPGGTTDVEIIFTPSVPGDVSAILEIESDDPDNSLVQVSLTGTGVRVEIPPLEQISMILDFFHASIDAGTLNGTGPNKLLKRANLMVFKLFLVAARMLIENDRTEWACQVLDRAYIRSDGMPKPSDLVEGSARGQLNEMIGQLMDDMGCK